ncbi:MAG: hypothetical protein QX199_05555 [Methylococcaceae bacterium]
MTFIVFSVMGEWQTDKWILPQQPVLPLARNTYDTIKPIFENAMRNDLEREKCSG